MRVTALYVALSALLALILAVRVTLARRRAKIGIGDGGDHELTKRIRAHANALENLPLALLLLLMLELAQTPPPWLHVFGCALIVGRIAHAIGLSRTSNISPGRALGMVLTWGVTLVMALLLLWDWLAWAVA